MNKFLFFALTLFAIFPMFCKTTNYGDIIVSSVSHVYDGNTFVANIKEYPPIIGKNIPIKIRGIETADINNKNLSIREKAQRAKQFLENLLKDKQMIILKNMKRDKYFRIIADVIIDGQNASDALLKNGFAVPYEKNKKVSFINTNF
ncbi:MAG: thermonuclease family protein [Parachlamydiales bacterium]|nr:thermonuclease family protein [Parachlamydiales bacterium]